MQILGKPGPFCNLLLIKVKGTRPMSTLLRIRSCAAAENFYLYTLLMTAPEWLVTARK